MRFKPKYCTCIFICACINVERNLTIYTKSRLCKSHKIKFTNVETECGYSVFIKKYFWINSTYLNCGVGRYRISQIEDFYWRPYSETLFEVMVFWKILETLNSNWSIHRGWIWDFYLHQTFLSTAPVGAFFPSHSLDYPTEIWYYINTYLYIAELWGKGVGWIFSAPYPLAYLFKRTIHWPAVKSHHHVQ